MKAQELLDQIFEKEVVRDSEEREHPLKANISREEGEFLRKILRETRPTNTIEVGCAYGISSLFICSELQQTPGAFHTIIDMLQSTNYKNIGVTNLNRAEIDFYKLIEKPSEIALPKLLDEGKQYDFGFIDGWHTLDHTLIDFFYINRMLKVGGVIVIDDVTYPSINKLMRYLLNYPCYELVGQIEMFSPKRQLQTALSLPLKLISRLMPKKLSQQIFASNISHRHKHLKLNTSMVALKKIAEDERSYTWYEAF